MALIRVQLLSLVDCHALFMRFVVVLGTIDRWTDARGIRSQRLYKEMLYCPLLSPPFGGRDSDLLVE